MTKPVQTEAARAAKGICSYLETQCGHDTDDIDSKCIEAICQQAVDAALSRVREMLEAKAKFWMGHDGMAPGITYKRAMEECASELLALAATLGNQGK